MNIKEFLERKKINNRDFSRLTGLSYSYVIQLINGDRMPSYEVCLRLIALTGGELTMADLRPPKPPSARIPCKYCGHMMSAKKSIAGNYEGRIEKDELLRDEILQILNLKDELLKFSLKTTKSLSIPSLNGLINKEISE